MLGIAPYLTGPWFQTQFTISVITGFSSFIAFCLLRRRFKAFFAPRQLLRGFTAHETHLAGEESFLGWIWPTLRVSEMAVLQLVGLDATVVSSALLCPATHNVWPDSIGSCCRSSNLAFNSSLCSPS